MTELMQWGNRVRVNWGRWIVDCDSPFCLSAVQVHPGQDWAHCRDCNRTIANLIWPEDPEAIEVILCMRPDEEVRNWVWPETINDLVMENVVHGIFPPRIELGAPAGIQMLVQVMDGRVVGGQVGLQLPSDSRRHAIEIGGMP